MLKIHLLCRDGRKLLTSPRKFGLEKKLYLQRERKHQNKLQRKDQEAVRRALEVVVSNVQNRTAIIMPALKFGVPINGVSITDFTHSI